MGKSPAMVYLDLEETVIRDWNYPELCNLDRIKNYIRRVQKSHAGCTFGVFSWTILDEDDLETFKSSIRPNLEKSYNIRFHDNLLTELDTLVDTLKYHFKLTSLHIHDLQEFYDKRMCFIEHCRARHSGYEGVIHYLSGFIPTFEYSEKNNIHIKGQRLKDLPISGQ